MAVYLDRRVLSILFFGFSSGLPILLVGNTLSARLFEAGVSLTAIGFVTLVGLAYGFKFLWSPLVDRVPIPVLTRRLGRRRSWLLVSQLSLVAAIFGLAAADPSTPQGLNRTILWGLVVAFASATQDIAVDAYRTEILEREKLGAGAANIQFGYRIGM
ncbi:MAG: AmpG family muropeptide MFS transporter, partial [Deltaproteobacteria bacterium]|nr:AmpG family muropeptide MFS transporter [Deltaproteobacteria bacterium]